MAVTSEAGPGRFALRGYGVVTYAVYDWDTDPSRRNAFDMERLVLYPSVRLAEGVTLRSEFEIEHAGTGSTLAGSSRSSASSSRRWRPGARWSSSNST